LANRLRPQQTLRSAWAVTHHRDVTLKRTPHLAGYDEVAQAKWAAWRKENLESACDEKLDDQIALVVRWLDPVSSRDPNKRIRFGWFSTMTVGTGYILRPDGFVSRSSPNENCCLPWNPVHNSRIGKMCRKTGDAWFR